VRRETKRNLQVNIEMAFVEAARLLLGTSMKSEDEK
jgi:hypothetical protein